MVRGFVQNQEVNLPVHQHAQPQAALLPSGQDGHGLEHVLPPEVIGRQAVPGALGGEAPLGGHHILHQVPVRVVEVDNLGQVGGLRLGPQLDAPVVGVQLSHDHLEEGGLSRPVVANEGDPLAPFHLQGNAVKQVLVPIRLG